MAWHLLFFYMQVENKFLLLRSLAILSILLGVVCAPVAANAESLRKMDFVRSIEASQTKAYKLTSELIKINQVRLIQQQASVQYFRDMFATHTDQKSFTAANDERYPKPIIEDMPIQLDEKQVAILQHENKLLDHEKADLLIPFSGVYPDQKSSTAANDERYPKPIIEDTPIQLDEKQVAIEQLKNRLSGREKPNLLIPFSSVKLAFYLISNSMNRLMISNLKAGQSPVFGSSGEVIGTKDTGSGKLTAGRDVLLDERSQMEKS
jgi:hypothetical protein